MAIPSPTPSPSPAPVQRHHHYLHWTPSSSPSPLAVSTTQTVKNLNQSPPPLANSKPPLDFSPTLIAMVVVVATAFLVITYSRLISRYLIRLLHRWRRWRRRRRRQYLPSSNGDLDSPPPLFDSPDGFHMCSPHGLDESVIKTLPLFLYTAKNSSNKVINNGKECAVCLLEFEDDDYVRTLPVCSHAFHVDCIDIWLRSHANCPLCRARILRSESPFIPLMAARIRPSFDDSVLRSITLEPVMHPPPPPAATNIVTEITQCIEEASPRRNSNNFNFNCNFNFNNYSQSEDRFVLKRSYSFSFERSCTSERMLTMEPATASPFRYRRGSFWNKRPSPFGSLSKSRVFSFRYYRAMKSPFTRRKGGFFPLSERYPATGGSSRRSKSTASTPMYYQRSWVAGGGFSSSRLRCGDPEALLSPERYSRR